MKEVIPERYLKNFVQGTRTFFSSKNDIAQVSNPALMTLESF